MLVLHYNLLAIYYYFLVKLFRFNTYYHYFTSNLQIYKDQIIYCITQFLLCQKMYINLNIVFFRFTQCECIYVLFYFQIKGVIFSIDYNPSKQLLASVSDDRSIILWKVKKKEISTCLSPTQLETETGHSDLSQHEANPGPLDLSEDVEFIQWKTLYGHKARVWDVRILNDYIISVGEVS